MKRNMVSLAVLAIAVAAAGLTAMAGDEPVKKREYKDRQEFLGRIVCIGCELEKLGADPQCTLYAKHAQGLLAPDGTLWTFVDNTRGHHLIAHKKLLDQQVKVVGWTFPKTQYIEAWSFFVKQGDAWVHNDYCKICGFEEGDNHGTDLCPGCTEDAEDGDDDGGDDR